MDPLQPQRRQGEGLYIKVTSPTQVPRLETCVLINVSPRFQFVDLCEPLNSHFLWQTPLVSRAGERLSPAARCAHTPPPSPPPPPPPPPSFFLAPCVIFTPLSGVQHALPQEYVFGTLACPPPRALSSTGGNPCAGGTCLFCPRNREVAGTMSVNFLSLAAGFLRICSSAKSRFAAPFRYARFGRGPLAARAPPRRGALYIGYEP